MSDSISVERRYTVYGHKNGKPFREGGPVFGDLERQRSIYQERIDNPPAEKWQPTITAVEFTERVVTPFRITETIGVVGPEYFEYPFVPKEK